MRGDALAMHPPGAMRRLMAGRPEFVLAPALFFVLLATWYLVTRYLAIPEFILPAPGKVWDSLVSGLATSPRNPAGYWYTSG